MIGQIWRKLLTSLEPTLNLIEDRSAYFSRDKKYRYWLKIVWDKQLPCLVVIGLNPSTADEFKDDPTVRKWKGIARLNGYGGIVVLNLFAFRATDPSVMLSESDPVGDENNYWITEYTNQASVALASWGTKGTHRGRCYEVEKQLRGKLKCLRFTSEGHPEHPLYIPYSAELKNFSYVEAS